MKKITTCDPAQHTHTAFKLKCASVFATILLLIFTAMNLQAQDPTWTKTYGTALNDAGYSIAKTYDGGYIVGGTTTFDTGNKDILLLKLDNEGDTLWSKTFGGTFNDESFCVKQCRDSGFVIAGYKSTGSSNMDFYIIKTDVNGNQQWNRTYGGTLNEGSYSIIQTFDLGFAVCGYTGSIGAGAKDMMLLKYDDTGIFQWQKTYGGVEDELAYAITQTEDSGFVMVGATKSYGENNLGDIYAIRTNSTGDTLWTKDYIYEGTDVAYDVTTVNGGYFIITGKTNSQAATTANFDAFALKINSEGNPIFFTTYGSQYDECAYAIKEMPDLSYILAGTTNNPESGGTGNDIYMVKIGEWGDTLDTQTYGTQYNDEARSFCIDDNENIVLVGKSFNPTTLNDLYFVSYAYCLIYYPRYIWINNIYNDAQIGSNVLTGAGGSINQTRLTELGTYLSTLRYSGIVITHTEDIFKNIDSANLKIQLAIVIETLHSLGIPVILNQFRGNESNASPFDSETDMIHYLSSSIIYNQTVMPLARFDGLELDYEFWQDDYGLTTNWGLIGTGYIKYQNIAGLFNAAKANPANHFKTLSMWVGTVLACDNWDTDGDQTSNTRQDDEMLMNMFDAHQFDRLVLSFFLDDLYDPTNTNNGPFQSPLSFLQRPDNGIDINAFFARLYYLGENNLRTNVVPNFHAGTGNGTISAPKLEPYLTGTGTWWGAPHGTGLPHFLFEVEQEFQNQFYDPDIFLTQNGVLNTNEYTWGTTSIMKGFEWFRYQIGPLDVSTVTTTRANDKIKSYHYYCGNTMRVAQSTILNTIFSATGSNPNIAVHPQPLKNNGELIVRNFDCDNTEAIKFSFYDITGQEISNALTIKSVEKTEFAIVAEVENKLNYQGLILIKATYNNQIIATTKALLIKNN